MISGDTAQTPDEGVDRRQPVDRGQRHRAAPRRRRGARLLLDARGQRARRGGRTLHGRATASSRRPTGAGDLWRARRRSRPRARSDRQARAEAGAGHKIVGTSMPRVDIPAKVTGGAAFIHDLRLPGHAARPRACGRRAMARSSTASTKPRRERMPGVVAVVRDGTFLGVVAEREEQAIEARAALAKRARSGRGAASCPMPARHLRAYRLRCRARTPTSASERQGRRCRRRHARWRRATRRPYHGARLDRPVLRARRVATTAR